MNMICNLAHPSWENYKLEGRRASRLVVGVTAGIGDPWAEAGESLACIAWSVLSSADNLISRCARALWTYSPRISPWWEIVAQSVLKSASRSRDLPDCSIMVTSKIKHIEMREWRSYLRLGELVVGGLLGNSYVWHNSSVCMRMKKPDGWGGTDFLYLCSIMKRQEFSSTDVFLFNKNYVKCKIRVI